jgi:hypothetical protein
MDNVIRQLLDFFVFRQLKVVLHSVEKFGEPKFLEKMVRIVQKFEEM